VSPGAGIAANAAYESQVLRLAAREIPILSVRRPLASVLLRVWRSTELANNQPIDREMAREILRYFVRNPQATDGLEGVARWRLMDEVIRRKLDETAAALEWLLAQGYLTSSISPGGTAIFRLNAERVEEIPAVPRRIARAPERPVMTRQSRGHRPQARHVDASRAHHNGFAITIGCEFPMPITPTYPGVYIEEIPSGVRPITGVATSIGAFVDFFPHTVSAATGEVRPHLSRLLTP
jgi:hypothetical protein